MWKVFDAQSWSALLSSLKQIKRTADGSSSAVSGLGEDFAGLAQNMSDAIREINAVKQDKQSAIPVTIPAAGWAQDGTAEYPCYLDVPVEGVTARDRADVTIAVSGLAAARACGMCPASETLEGKIRFRAKAVPAADIAAECWISGRKE